MARAQFTFTLIHGIFYSLVVNGYLFSLMITLSPRIWGYQDYPETIKQKVPPQTKHERAIAGIAGIPFLLFTFGFPVYSVLRLRAQLGGEISFEIAVIHLLVLVLLTSFFDMVVLDWFIISKVTPDFVIIPGSDVEDYKDFSHHYRAHAKATIILIVVCLIIAVFVTRL